MKKIPEHIKQQIIDSKKILEKNIRDKWENLKKIKLDTDVPNLPIPMTPYHIERLIAAGAIPKKDLIDGKTYYGKCRNAYKAVWHADKNAFTYLRYKFSYTYDEDINHFEDDDGYDLFVPISLLDE